MEAFYCEEFIGNEATTEFTELCQDLFSIVLWGISLQSLS